MKKEILSSALMLSAVMAMAVDKYEANFSYGMPRNVVVEQIDGGQLDQLAYRHIAKDASWVVAKSSATNRSLLSPTRNVDGTARANRIIFPAVTVSSTDAAVCWDARSMHRNMLDSYVVLGRQNGGEWQVIDEIVNENYAWTTRRCSLAPFEGTDVEIAFETTTAGGEGFMLAMDNLVIGVEDNVRVSISHTAPHYEANGSTVELNVSLESHGIDPGYKTMILRCGEVEQQLPVGEIACGESREFTFVLPLADDSINEYVVECLENDGDVTTLFSDYVVSSPYKRTLLVDRLSAVWCNNCPSYSLVLKQYEELFGEEMLVVEAHVTDENDPLTDSYYWNDYARFFTFEIPQHVLNHDEETVKEEAFNDGLLKGAEAGIEVKAELNADGTVKATATAEFANTVNNVGDRYRIGYMLLTTVHDVNAMELIQDNLANSEVYEEYYYLPEYILPSMMWYENVVADGSCATNGVPASLPDVIEGATPIVHSRELINNVKFANDDLTVVAMVIDTHTKKVLNCAVAKLNQASGIEDIKIDESYARNGAVYDINGRRVAEDITETKHLSPGTYIVDGQKIFIR